MIEVSVASNEVYASSSNIIDVTPGKKYAAFTRVAGVSGEPKSALFGVALFDDNDKVIERKVVWLNDFSGEEKDYTVEFEAPKKCNKIKILYRINKDTPAKSACKFRILPIKDANVFEDGKRERNLNQVEPVPRTKDLSPEEELVLEQNVVWIFSSPKSGTTWLGTELLSYQTNTINEPLIGRHLTELRESSDRYARDIDARENGEHFFFNRRYSNTWKFWLRKLILQRIYAQYPDLEHKVIIKEPNGSMTADVISQCMPNSKIIILVRDGRDTVDSRLGYLTRGGRGSKWAPDKPRPSEPQNRRMNVVRVRSKLWTTNMEFCLRAYEGHAASRRLMIRYEDLRFNTLELTRKIYQFIDVSIPDDVLRSIVDENTFENIPASQKGAGTFVRAASPGKWKKDFNEEEIEAMQNIMGSMLQRLGYPI